MACPNCGCKVCYQYDGGASDHEPGPGENIERCSACGHIFDIEDHEPEDEEERP